MKKSYTFSLIKLIQELFNRLEVNLSALKSLCSINDIQGCYKIYYFHVLIKVIKISFYLQSGREVQNNSVKSETITTLEG